MKAIFLSFVLLISSLCASVSLNDDLRQLLKVMEVPHDNTLPSIVEATQKRWIRPAGKERWEIENTLSTVQAQAIVEFCTRNHFFSEIKPAHQNYDYAVILGAAVCVMEKRIAFLEKIADSGVKFKQIVLLSGARPLDPKVDRAIEGCQTEGDAMDYLWRAHPLSKQTSWKHFIRHMIPISEGKTRRPNTADTFLLWKASQPQAGSCLMISSQPYCFSQQLIAEACLPGEFTFETVGPAFNASKQNPTVMLDTLARCLFMLDSISNVDKSKGE
jgi:hypothetical protein